jgi:ATP-dependent DNA helicase RecQ
MEKLALATLRKYFGFSEFRDGQLEIVLAILQRKDVLAILPTGGGKSLCFQVPALALSGTTLVVSPLISLMKDQVDHLLAKNIAASYLSSNLDKSEIEIRLRKLGEGAYKLFYVAPERLSNQHLVAICQKLEIPLLVVDEAHCISLWGHQFRPSYQKIPEFIKKIDQKRKKIVTAAFTATANAQTKKEIKHFLNIDHAQEFAHGFIRSNLIFHNIICPSLFAKNTWLFKLLKDHHSDNIIIYCATRKACEQLLKIIQSLDFHKRYQLAVYHGGLEKEQREIAQDLFLKSKIKIMIATNAFGMGVDKSDVRVIIHYQLSANLENYYQEAGRAGRDGQTSYAYLLYQEADVLIQRGMLIASCQGAVGDRLQVELNKLELMRQYAISHTCLQDKIAKYFGDHDQNNICANCQFCLRRHLDLNQNELDFIDEDHHPALTIQQLELAAILEPRSLDDWKRLPGVGSGIIDAYANQTISR